MLNIDLLLPPAPERVVSYIDLTPEDIAAIHRDNTVNRRGSIFYAASLRALLRYVDQEGVTLLELIWLDEARKLPALAD